MAPVPAPHQHAARCTAWVAHPMLRARLSHAHARTAKDRLSPTTPAPPRHRHQPPATRRSNYRHPHTPACATHGQHTRATASATTAPDRPEDLAKSGYTSCLAQRTTVRECQGRSARRKEAMPATLRGHKEYVAACRHQSKRRDMQVMTMLNAHRAETRLCRGNTVPQGVQLPPKHFFCSRLPALPLATIPRRKTASRFWPMPNRLQTNGVSERTRKTR